jgi:hypothetical protein
VRAIEENEFSAFGGVRDRFRAVVGRSHSAIPQNGSWNGVGLLFDSYDNGNGELWDLQDELTAQSLAEPPVSTAFDPVGMNARHPRLLLAVNNGDRVWHHGSLDDASTHSPPPPHDAHGLVRTDADSEALLSQAEAQSLEDELRVLERADGVHELEEQSSITSHPHYVSKCESTPLPPLIPTPTPLCVFAPDARAGHLDPGRRVDGQRLCSGSERTPGKGAGDLS